jgi:hypothetical protein
MGVRAAALSRASEQALPPQARSLPASPERSREGLPVPLERLRDPRGSPRSRSGRQRPHWLRAKAPSTAALAASYRLDLKEPINRSRKVLLDSQGLAEQDFSAQNVAGFSYFSQDREFVIKRLPVMSLLCCRQ